MRALRRGLTTSNAEAKARSGGGRWAVLGGSLKKVRQFAWEIGQRSGRDTTDAEHIELSLSPAPPSPPLPPVPPLIMRTGSLSRLLPRVCPQSPPQAPLKLQTTDEKLKYLSQAVDDNHSDLKKRLEQVERTVRESADAIASGLKAIEAFTRQQQQQQPPPPPSQQVQQGSLHAGGGCDTFTSGEPVRTSSIRGPNGYHTDQASVAAQSAKPGSSSFSGKYGCHRKQRQKPRNGRINANSSAAGGGMNAAAIVSAPVSCASCGDASDVPAQVEDAMSLDVTKAAQQDQRESREDLREESRAARKQAPPKSSPFDA